MYLFYRRTLWPCVKTLKGLVSNTEIQRVAPVTLACGVLRSAGSCFQELLPPCPSPAAPSAAARSSGWAGCVWESIDQRGTPSHPAPALRPAALLATPQSPPAIRRYKCMLQNTLHPNLVPF